MSAAAVLTSAVDLDAGVEDPDAQVRGILVDPVLQQRRKDTQRNERSTHSIDRFGTGR